MLLIGKNEIIGQLLKRHDLDTADFASIRWLGDRKGIEDITTEWDKVVIDRRADLTRWVVPVQQLLSRGRQVYGFFDNHYAGHAPASLELFQQLLFSQMKGVQCFNNGSLTLCEVPKLPSEGFRGNHLLS